MKLPRTGNSLDLDRRVHVMGIVNVTPDSFSDGGLHETEEAVGSAAGAMVEAGADIIDVGGESTRPYAPKVEEDEELRRVIPAIRVIRARHDIPISIDTTKAAVARAALDAGADIINDISACRFDAGMAPLAAATGVPIVIMHMQGTPGTMQDAPRYDDVVAESVDFFHERLDFLEKQGVERGQIIIDPGIGFGKQLRHNLLILRHLERYLELGVPVLVGHSRKSFIGAVTGREVHEREAGTTAVSALCALKGAAIIRVHDVAAGRDAAMMMDAVKNASQQP